MNRVLILGGAVAFTILLSWGVYHYNSQPDPSDLLTIQANLQGNLILAKKKLNTEQSTLDAMLAGFKNFFAPQISVQDQMKKLSNTIKQSDFLFSGTDGFNPEIILKGPFKGLDINTERGNIGVLLKEWQDESDILAVDKFNVDATDKIKEDGQKIKEFLVNLSQILNSLTPENSGLSQSEIDTYISQLPTIDSINDILNSLNRAIDDANRESADGTTTPPFTSDDIANEQSAVDNAQHEVNSTEDELKKVQDQIQQSTPTPAPDPATPTPDSVAPVVPPATPDPAPIDVNPKSINPNTRAKYNSIIIQPGPPQLIQGTDPY